MFKLPTLNLVNSTYAKFIISVLGDVVILGNEILSGPNLGLSASATHEISGAVFIASNLLLLLNPNKPPA